MHMHMRAHAIPSSGLRDGLAIRPPLPACAPFAHGVTIRSRTPSQSNGFITPWLQRAHGLSPLMTLRQAHGCSCRCCRVLSSLATPAAIDIAPLTIARHWDSP